MTKLNESDTFERVSRREVDFLHAINAIAVSLQSAVHSETAVFNAFTEQFVKLGLHGSINLIDSTGQFMVVRAMAMPSKLQKIIKAVEKLIGFSLEGYRYNVEKSSLNQDAIKAGQTIFMRDNSQRIREVMPKASQTAINLMVKFFTGHPSITAPIMANEGKIQGLLYASGEWLKESDVPAITAFANHISIALKNARLMEEMQTAKASMQRVNSTLAASRDAIHGLVQQMPVGIQVFDPDGLCVDVNETHLNIFGTTKKQLVRNYNIFTDPFAAEIGIHAAVDRVLDGEVVQMGDLDFYFEQADGRFSQKNGQRTVNVTLFPVFGSAGQVVQFVRLNVDVTQRKENEKALSHMSVELAQQRQMIDAMLTTTPDGFSFMDINGRYLYASPLVLHDFQMTMPEIIGKTWSEIGVSKELNEKGNQAIQQMLDTAKPVMIEYGYWLNDEYHEREFIFSPLISPQGEIFRYVITSREVTERKRELAAFQEAQKMESLGILAGGIAHDFNNLLVAMLGQTSLALKKLPEDNSARPNIQKAMNAAQKAADLTRQMLAYSGRGNFEVQPLNLNQLIEENLHLFNVVIPNPVEFVLNLQPTLPFVDADPGQMQQIVMNLLLNAAEALEKHGGTIVVSTLEMMIENENVALWRRANQTLKPGKYVALRVADDGVGMDQDTVQKIFDPFFTTKFTGRGLGLAAVLGIVRGHYGGLRVLSQKGDGTTFEIVFPISQKSKIEPKSDVDDVLTKSGVVLVIDDEQGVREFVQEILGSEGIEVITAVNGQNGINIFQQRHHDINLVLLDLSMPGMSGVETCSQLRQINPNIPILLASGYSEAESLGHFKQDNGLSGFIQKPFHMQTLIRTIYTHLPNRVDKP
ncbi:MAG: PAS domain-containing sensor histidine kinase [Chloroflexi bacterium]|nr:MAG: PAS domain-containing sensor histidine kinase [Chloroflexota bacterium]